MLGQANAGKPLAMILGHHLGQGVAGMGAELAAVPAVYGNFQSHRSTPMPFPGP